MDSVSARLLIGVEVAPSDAGGWQMFDAPDSLEPSMGARRAPRTARDGPAHRTSATHVNSTPRLRSGIEVETALFSRWKSHHETTLNASALAKRASRIRSAVETPHQVEVTVCCAGPSRAVLGARRAPTDGSSESGATRRHLRRGCSTASKSLRHFVSTDPPLKPLPNSAIQTPNGGSLPRADRGPIS